jgi:hypothetical protein
MSQKQQTQSNQTQTGTFNPASMAAFNAMIPQFQQAVSGYMNQPFNNPFFQTQRQMGTDQAQQQGGTQMSSLLGNLNTQGFGGNVNAPFANEMVANQSRANAGLQSQLGFLNPVQNALGMQQFAMGQAGGFKPFQTGGTQQGTETQSMSGLGTWLPQLISGGLGAMTGAMGGGGLLGKMGGSGGGGNSPFLGMAGGGSGQLPQAYSPFMGSQSGNSNFMPMPFPGGGGGGSPFFGGTS